MKIDKTSNGSSNNVQEEATEEIEKTLYEKGEDIKTGKWKEDSLDLRAKTYVGLLFIYLFIYLFI